MTRRWRLWISLAVGLVLLCMLCACNLLLLRLVFAPTRLEGQSMEPALHSGELLWMNTWAYRQHLPARGDVIIFLVPVPDGGLSFKRVIGLPGEEVAILDGAVLIDGTPLAEPYIDVPTLPGKQASVKLSDREVFVLGDNRNHSTDSRTFGPLPLDNIVGKAVLVVSPGRMQVVPKVSYPTPGTGP
jgi:signal peptidase I